MVVYKLSKKFLEMLIFLLATLAMKSSSSAAVLAISIRVEAMLIS